ncbi:uncharacterized protein PFL1_02303 [Pseudozyma flocculosa PF-1]|uniref:Uncharacterized protein n=1 Tax=Pseudozyma flocculosa TaxID=84751 RepID=A0A5C3F835_9BASI|nr:uncharacterized protein PFL1_02303 [Pseudozyma flocculosa PF-1]EPQ30187.1 hypothetical protein PFL1_02303 [Pseudozyma flocculosa PF-1]SPO39887.1 uncharacterized protein PSFLO_05368 [Pseudozyma flocculosa]
MTAVAHASSIGAAFDALGLDEGRLAGGPPPPTFFQATTASNIQGQAAIPIYIAPLRDRIVEASDRHTSLTQRLEALGDVPARMERDKEALYQCSGRLSSLRARTKTFESDDRAARKAYSDKVGNFAKRIINKRPARGRAVALAKDHHERARTDLEQHLDLIRATEAELLRIRAELSDLELKQVEYLQLVEDLEHLNDSLFAGPTPEFPEEDLLEWEHNVLVETGRQLQAEANRERRARQLLNQASPSLTACITDLRKALQICIELGVANNRKYSHQMFVGGSTSATVKATTSLVLRTKTNSGKFYTTIAKARGSQALVRRAPDFSVIELHLMPGQRSPKAVDEKGLHKAMEGSYAQARFCETYLRDEISQSVGRQAKLKEQGALLEEHIAQARRELDAYRRRIVVAVASGNEAALLDDVAALPSCPLADPHQPKRSVAFSVGDLGARHTPGPVILGNVINGAILRETVLSHTRQRSFSLTTTGTVTQLVDLRTRGGDDDDDDDDEAQVGRRGAEGSDDDGGEGVERQVAVQSTKDPNVAATVAMSAVTDVESPAERLRKEALRRLRAILARSIGTPEIEELPSYPI